MNKIDISFVQPPEAAIDIDGVEYVLRPIKMRTLPALVRCVEPALADLTQLILRPSLELAFKVVGKDGDLVCEAVALCTGKDVRTIGELLPDRLAALLLVCCEMNADFFGRAVPSFKGQAGLAAPLLVGKLNSLLEQLEQKSSIGATPSPSSSTQATLTATS